jgi:hypothetical protein
LLSYFRSRISFATDGGGAIGMLFSFLQWRTYRLNVTGITGVVSLCWTILACTQIWLLLADIAKADPLRVVAIGASNTSGWNVSSEKTYPQVLEQMLRSRG